QHHVTSGKKLDAFGTFGCAACYGRCTNWSLSPFGAIGVRGTTRQFCICSVRVAGGLVCVKTTRCTRIRSCLICVTAVVGSACIAPDAQADTLRGALTQAYQNNPQLNAQRASVRATDETVPQALSGYRPRISLSAQVGEAYSDTTTRSVGA